MSAPRVVLVVDDQEITREVVWAMLEHEDVEVHAAHDGATALKMAVELAPDVVLLDVVMPGVDGIEVCKALRALPRPPRVVMLTGKSDLSVRQAAIEAGADAYLLKPFSAYDLYRAVEEPVRGA
jgi:two-component system response regulator VicR